MKHIFLFLLALMPASLWALNYCQTSSWGYAGDVTGGGTATPVLVSDYNGLKSAMNTPNSVIIITQDICFPSGISCSKSNLTIMALPGVELTTAGVNIGFFSFGTCRNIILRNLFFRGSGSDTQQQGDALTFNGVKHAWVDHCTFQDGSDGNFDIVKTSDSITVSWCRFRYVLDTGNGHRFSNLIASNSSQAPDDGTYNLTFAFCWWDHGCEQRMTRSRHASIHFLNCYWNSRDAMYYIGPENTDCYVENGWFEGPVLKDSIFYTGFGGVNGVRVVGSYSAVGFPSVTGRPVATPPYGYLKVDSLTAKNMVTSACGAGPTLQVTAAAAVSSSCDTATEVWPDTPSAPFDPNDPGQGTGSDDPNQPAQPTVETDSCGLVLRAAITGSTSATIDGQGSAVVNISSNKKIDRGRYVTLSTPGGFLADDTVGVYVTSANNCTGFALYNDQAMTSLIVDTRSADGTLVPVGINHIVLPEGYAGTSFTLGRPSSDPDNLLLNATISYIEVVRPCPESTEEPGGTESPGDSGGTENPGDSGETQDPSGTTTAQRMSLPHKLLIDGQLYVVLPESGRLLPIVFF